MRGTRVNLISKLILLLSIFSLNTSFAYTSDTNQNIKKQARFAPGVVSIIQDHRYIRAHDAPVYWKISPNYLPQPTDASCSLTTATMVINSLQTHQLKYAYQKLATTDSVASSIKTDEWKNDVKQGGNGTSLDKLGFYLTEAIKAYHIKPVKLTVVHVTKDNKVAKQFHQALMDGEKTGRTFIIVNFDQYFISGTDHVGHFSPVGAYDAKTKRVLIMDPDREFFEPYWVPEHLLLKSMEGKDSSVNKNRGFIIVKLVDSE